MQLTTRCFITSRRTEEFVALTGTTHMKKFLLAALAAVGLCSTTHADIIWVDHVLTGPGANTTLADGTAMNLVIENDRVNPEDYYFNPTNTINAQSDANNSAAFWGERGNFGTTSVLVAPEARGGAAQTTSEDVPTLKTTLTGLVSGETYNLFGYYWSQNQGAGNPGQSWDARYSLDGVNFTVYNDLDQAATATLGTFAPGFAPTETSGQGGEVLLTQANLGTAVAVGGQIEIYFDDGPDPQRTWYDGVGYEIVAVPEPSTFICLFGAVGFLGLKRRRN